MIKKLIKVLMVSTLVFGSYLFLEEEQNQQHAYSSGDIQLNNEDHPEY